MLVVVPLTTKLPVTVKSFDIVTSAGSPYVIVPELSETSTSFEVPANVIVPPNAVAVVFWLFVPAGFFSIAFWFGILNGGN